MLHLGHEAGRTLTFTWKVVSLLLLISWVDLDCRERKAIYRPFDFGYLLLLFWPLYVPYYLFRTRGVLAVVWLAGFAALSCTGYFLTWVIHAAGWPS